VGGEKRKGWVVVRKEKGGCRRKKKGGWGILHSELVWVFWRTDPDVGPGLVTDWEKIDTCQKETLLNWVVCGDGFTMIVIYLCE